VRRAKKTPTASPAGVGLRKGEAAKSKKDDDVKEAKKRHLYREMVRAVRAWIAVEHPRPRHDRVDIAFFDDMGGGETIAGFHARESCPYVLGDLMALKEM
jgi:hypothetical protein